MTTNLEQDKIDKLRDWEKVLMQNGYTPQDIIDITTGILHAYEYMKGLEEARKNVQAKEISGDGSGGRVPVPDQS
jgi:hypothetical protein